MTLLVGERSEPPLGSWITHHIAAHARLWYILCVLYVHNPGVLKILGTRLKKGNGRLEKQAKVARLEIEENDRRFYAQWEEQYIG